MKTATMIAASAALLAWAANAAEPRYDRKLEKAAIEIAAAKVGDIRGGFAFGDKPKFVVAPAATADGGPVRKSGPSVN